MNTAAGSFETTAAARRAAARLQAIGIAADDVTVLSPGDSVDASIVHARNSGSGCAT